MFMHISNFKSHLQISGVNLFLLFTFHNADFFIGEAVELVDEIDDLTSKGFSKPNDFLD
jgi:hypothetical protein